MGSDKPTPADLERREAFKLRLCEWLAENLDCHIGKAGRDEPFDRLLDQMWDAAREEGERASWVSVGSPPNSDAWVLVCGGPYEHTQAACFAVALARGATHWQPLPAPPEGGTR